MIAVTCARLHNYHHHQEIVVSARLLSVAQACDNPMALGPEYVPVVCGGWGGGIFKFQLPDYINSRGKRARAIA
jgi:hypothetical protein